MSFKVFLSESDYSKRIVEIFQKAIRDELTASAVYQKASAMLSGPGSDEIKEHLQEHAKEEYQHYSEFIDYASRHNFLNDLNIILDQNSLNPKGNDYEIVKFTQDLEMIAAQDYKNAADFCFKHNDTETYEFFKEKLADEIRHFDEDAYYLNQKRELE